ncbi:MAG: hypothetical protein N838_09820 [Thiohalocapsa sp. PB-PSB1]|nr:MAG: hypothetical protein N838_09820 [Thiohalocapsa sp. PB-PSB1]
MPRYLALAAVTRVVTGKLKRPFTEVDLIDMVEQQFGLEALGMSAHALHQIRAEHAVGITGPIIDVGGCHELSTLFEAGY